MKIRVFLIIFLIVFVSSLSLTDSMNPTETEAAVKAFNTWYSSLNTHPLKVSARVSKTGDVHLYATERLNVFP